MINNLEYDHMSALIQKYLSGECTKAESDRLALWVEEDDKHRVYFVQLKEAWMLSMMVDKPITPKTGSWSELLRKSEAGRKNRSKTKIFSLSTVVKIAASLLMLFSVLFLVKSILQKDQFHFDSEHHMAEAILPDDSEVILSDKSSITYNLDDSGARVVDLYGTGYFSVTHNAHAPFVITNEGTQVRVLGTSFFVDNLNDSKVTLVSVATGSVSVSLEDEELILKAGETAYIDKSNKTLRKEANPDDNFMFFKTGKLTFENQDLIEVVKQINKYYGSDVTISPNIKTCKLTAVYQDKSLEALLEILIKTFSLQISNQNSSIFLDGSC